MDPDRVKPLPLLHTNLGAIIRLQINAKDQSNPYAAILFTIVSPLGKYPEHRNNYQKTYGASESFLPQLTAISHSSYATH